MLAHRPFLLKNVTKDRIEIQELAKESINECIVAAQSVLESVDRMARDGRLFHAFWWTHYVCFCALVCVYVWAIQQSNDSQGDDRSHAKIFNQAERCLTHLAQATQSNTPSRRYSIILQELRAEAKRKTARRPVDSTHFGASETQGGHLAPPPQSITGTSPNIDEWEPMFGSPIDNSMFPVMLDNWQTTDWLDLDSSAFQHFSSLDTGSFTWMGEVPR